VAAAKPRPVGEAGESEACMEAELEREGEGRALDVRSGGSVVELLRLVGVLSSEGVERWRRAKLGVACLPGLSSSSESGSRGLNSSQGRVSSNDCLGGAFGAPRGPD
jgi:hypothetical protein